MSAYGTIARYYDLEHATLKADISFYINFAEAAMGNILVAGAGTGRVALALAEAGFEVTGIDSCSEMLEVARGKPAAGKAELLEADVRDFELGRQFALILTPLDTLNMLVTVDDRLAALRSLRKHLAKDGTLIVDVVNPHTLPLADENGRLRQRFQATKGPALVSCNEAIDIDPAAQTMTMHLTYDSVESGVLTRETADLTVVWTYRFELELAMEAAGLGVSNAYGSYDLDPYETTSPRLIVTALSAER